MGRYFEDSLEVVDRPSPTAVRTNRFWRLDDPVINDARRIVRGGFWPYQRDFWNLPTFVKLLVAGYGAGKTNIGAKRIISSALQNAPVPVAYVAPTFPLARQTGIATIQSLLAGKQTLLGRRLWWRYNKSTHEFKIRYGGRDASILVYSGEDPLSLRGPNLASVWMDEPFIMVRDVFEQMIARTRHPDARMLEMVLTGTPEQLNWGFDLCMGELKDQMEATGYGVGLVQGSTRGNLALDPGYVKRLEGVFTEKAAQAYIDGAFVQLGSGLIYYGFSGLNGPNVVDLPIPAGAEIGCGMDFNVDPMAFTIFWRAGSHVHYIDEYEVPNSDTQYVCAMLRERFVDLGPKRLLPPQYTLRTVYPDATGNARKTASPGAKSDFFYIKEAGFEIKAHDDNPRVRDRENAVNGKFKPASGPVTLTIGPRCKKLIKYLSTSSHELRKKQKKMSHLLDAFGYPIAYLFPVNKEKLVVQRFGGA